MRFQVYFTPLPGFFSPFPHGTCSLSVDYEYLALEDGPPIFRQSFSCSVLLDFIDKRISCTGLSPTTAALSRAFHYSQINLRASPRSLATTKGISVDFYSSGYLDVSVPLVRLTHLCIQCVITSLCWLGSPIQRSPDQSLFADSPELIAGYNVFHRL